MRHVEPQVNATSLPEGLVLYMSLFGGVIVHYLSTMKCLCFTQKHLSAFPSYPFPTPPAPFAADGLMLDSCRVSTVKPFTPFTFNL